MSNRKKGIRYAVAIVIALIVSIVGVNIISIILGMIDGMFNLNIMYTVTRGNGNDVFFVELTPIGIIVLTSFAILIFIATMKTLNNRLQPKEQNS